MFSYLSLADQLRRNGGSLIGCRGLAAWSSSKQQLPPSSGWITLSHSAHADLFIQQGICICVCTLSVFVSVLYLYLYLDGWHPPQCIFRSFYSTGYLYLWLYLYLYLFLSLYLDEYTASTVHIQISYSTGYLYLCLCFYFYFICLWIWMDDRRPHCISFFLRPALLAIKPAQLKKRKCEKSCDQLQCSCTKVWQINNFDTDECWNIFIRRGHFLRKLLSATLVGS